MKKSPSTQVAPRKPLVVWPTARRPAWISDEELEWLPADAFRQSPSGTPNWKSRNLKGKTEAAG